MVRSLISAASLSLLILSACAKSGNDTATAVKDSLPPAGVPATGADPDVVVPAGGIRVQGWTGRLDPQAMKAGKTLADASFDLAADTIRVVSGPAAIYWNPVNTARGNYTVSATFIQNQKSAHAEGYGLILSGTNLDKPNQAYVYFLVRQDGKFLINHRASDTEVHKLVDWTSNFAVKTPGSEGPTTNALSIAVGDKALSFKVNGKEVKSLPRSSLDTAGPDSGTSGIYGLRINHNLNVSVLGLTSKPQG